MKLMILQPNSNISPYSSQNSSENLSEPRISFTFHLSSFKIFSSFA